MEILKITNEEGKMEQLEVIDKLSLNGNDYVIVSQEGSEYAYAYKTKIKDGFMEYKSVGVGPEFRKVLEAYNVKNN